MHLAKWPDPLIYKYIYIIELKKKRLHGLSLQACFVSNSHFRKCDIYLYILYCSTAPKFKVI